MIDREYLTILRISEMYPFQNVGKFKVASNPVISMEGILYRFTGSEKCSKLTRMGKEMD